MKFKKAILSIGLIILIFTLVSCRNNNESEEVDPGSLVGSDEIFSLPFDTVGEITVMQWSGGGEFLRDVGRRDIAPEDIYGLTDATVISSAKVFNSYFPNIIINSYTTNEDESWDFLRQNFSMEYGHYPDIFVLIDLVSDVKRGMIADLSIFSDDPMYQAFNPVLMDMVTIDDRAFALPSYVLPAGIFVNRSLAERENIDIPPVDWTIEQYLQFTNNSRVNDYYGAMGIFWHIANSGTLDFHRQIANRGPNDPFVRVNSEATRNILGMLHQMVNHTVWAQNELGNVSPEYLDEGWWWGGRFFAMGRLLTHADDSWMIHDMSHPDNPDHWLGNVIADWDVYPMPSTNYVGNHVSLVVDPLAIRNYAMDDNNPILSPEEYDKLAIAWEYLKFHIGDTRAWEARANQRYNAGESMGFALSESFPIVTGQAFDDQMDIWFTSGREILRDSNSFPGFHYVIELLQKGEFAAYSYNNTPWSYDFEGEQREILQEWNNKSSAEFAGASYLDPQWIDELFARLPHWEVEFNRRFEQAFLEIDTAVQRFYPVQQRGGQ